ncbi:torsin-1A-interacting protein 2-like [Notolabrus celidotus]|uniref:torsin-1A-interacting protein 2-like n=1 Tax=Notolabrus celidotus TaxID=1203425 RepID=UPI00148F6DEC|nr:torsin-1A-interacting protein 2-like [Notolabrus celidotus]XP_034566669.1 torsin-1A-interacting protein 2-like [Notolabrus celidotus]
MAEQLPDTKHLQTADDAQLTTTCHDGCKPEEADNALGVNLQQPDAKEKMAPPTEGSASPDHDKMPIEESNPPTQADDGAHGDCEGETKRNELSTKAAEEIARKYHTGETAAQDIATPQDDRKDDRKDDHVDGPNNTSTKEEDDVRSSLEENQAEGEGGQEEEGREEEGKEEEEEKKENLTTPSAKLQPKISVEEPICLQRNDVETIGPTTEETREPVNIFGGNRLYLMAVFCLVLAFLINQLLPATPPQKNDEQQVDIFLRHMEKIMTQFPNQRLELWKRSKIHLLKHLQTAQPTEPVSLILTAGLRGERTLHCLAQGMASAFSSALNASVLHIDGASKASQDSDQVKLDIDTYLQGAFEGDKPVAIIHRFEELPPSSTLIFYRYCDHENAAYKKTFLIFTVLLGEEEEIPATSRLSAVEEMVDDHLQKKFLSDGHPVSYDRMDLDKYGGLWSRISHLILPVAAEDKIEHNGC